MLRHALASSSIALLTLGWVTPLAAAPPPDTMRVSGQRLELAGHGTRNAMLFIELYSVALYLPRDLSDRGAIQRSEVAKALRVQILYDGSLPDRIPAGWRAELMPVLEPAQRRALVRAYQQLESQDEITITYAPEAGTTVAVNGRSILQDEGAEVMNAFLDVWIGRRPVSEDLKKLLL